MPRTTYPDMALFRTRSAAVFGIEAHLIEVEVEMYPGGSARDFITVGMPDTAVRESRERINSPRVRAKQLSSIPESERSGGRHAPLLSCRLKRLTAEGTSRTVHYDLRTDLLGLRL